MGTVLVLPPAKMARFAQLILAGLIWISPTVASAGPAEDANAAVDRWSAAFNTNDPETIAKNYCPDAILLGTVSPVMSEATQAIITYFTPTKGTGNKNAIDERRTIIIDDNAVVVTGFYTFTRKALEDRVEIIEAKTRTPRQSPTIKSIPLAACPI